MPTQISSWKCDYCNSEFATLEEASACQSQSLPKLDFDIGQFIDFQSENIRPSSSAALPTEQGTYIKNERHVVIGLIMVRNVQTGVHGLGYITRNPESPVPIERLVFFYPAEYSADNKELWFSPAENRYQLGFAEQESIHINNPELYLQLKSE
jgi:hypothetical protein